MMIDGLKVYFVLWIEVQSENTSLLIYNQKHNFTWTFDREIESKAKEDKWRQFLVGLCNDVIGVRDLESSWQSKSKMGEEEVTFWECGLYESSAEF